MNAQQMNNEYRDSLFYQGDKNEKDKQLKVGSEPKVISATVLWNSGSEVYLGKF